MTKKRKKSVAARRSPAPEALRQPARCQETAETPRQPARRQETADAPRQPASRQETAEGSYDQFNLVLPPELTDLAARIQAAQVRTTQPPPLRQVPATQSGATTQQLPPRQVPATQSGTTTQQLPPRQPPATQSGTRARELLLSQDTIETIPSRLQS